VRGGAHLAQPFSVDASSEQRGTPSTTHRTRCSAAVSSCRCASPSSAASCRLVVALFRVWSSLHSRDSAPQIQGLYFSSCC
jgi:hypothetical protein